MMAFIIGCIWGVIVLFLAFKNQWTKKKIIKWSVIGVVVLALGGTIINGGSSSSYDKQGYAYVLKQLKAPTTAELISVVGKNKFKSFLKDECNIVLPDGLEAEYYEIASQNGFGAQIRSEFVVFFYHGKPIHLEEGLLCFESQRNWGFCKKVIEINTGIKL